MASEETEKLIDEMFEGPAKLVGYAMALAHPDIERMLSTHGRRFQTNEGYAPHLHGLEVVRGLIELLKSGGDMRPGYDRHQAIGVNTRPDLIYLVGAMPCVFAIRDHAARLADEGQVISHRVMAEFEQLFSWSLSQYGGQGLLDVSWPTHEAQVDLALNGLNPTPAQADSFWRDVIAHLPNPEVVATAVCKAFQTLTPPKIAKIYVGAFYRYQHKQAQS